MGIFNFKSSKNIRLETVNGKSKIIIDGVDVTPETNEKQITIIIEGNPQRVDVDVCNSITINGSCEKVSSQTGDINISGNVSGDVKSGTGEIECQNVQGNVESGTGDISVSGSVTGRVSSSTGDIRISNK